MPELYAMTSAFNITHRSLFLRDARDAHVVLEAVRLNLLPLVRRRLSSDERQQLVSGNVYVWEESQDDGLLVRWTDGRKWGQSRMQGDYLFYEEKVDFDPMRRKHPSKPNGLTKQTYSVLVNVPGLQSPRKWHVVAYFSGDDYSQLPTIDSYDYLKSISVPDGIFVSARISIRPDRINNNIPSLDRKKQSSDDETRSSYDSPHPHSSKTPNEGELYATHNEDGKDTARLDSKENSEEELLPGDDEQVKTVQKELIEDPSTIRRRRPRRQRLRGFDVGGDQDVIETTTSDESSESEEDDSESIPEYTQPDDTHISVYWNNDEKSEYYDYPQADTIQILHTGPEKPGLIACCAAYASTLPTHILPRLRHSSRITGIPGLTPGSLTCVERVLSWFTFYESLCTASTTQDPIQKKEYFNRVFTRLQTEWVIVAGLLVALMAFDVAVFAIPSGPDAMLQIDHFALNSILTSLMASVVGLAWTAWFLVSYNGADLDTFISRAQDLFSTYFFFAFSSRFPALFMATSVFSIICFLGRVAYVAWPMGTLVFGICSAVLMTLQYLLYSVVWGIYTIRKLFNELVQC